jgi:uncharacterized GH25 family protein
MRKALVGALIVIAIGGVLFWKYRSHNGAGSAASQPERPGLKAPHKPSGPHEEPAAAVLFDDDPAGTLRLEGEVIDAEDHPVSGATVTITSHPPRTTTTEADGGFHFDKLVARPYTLVAHGDKGVAGPVTAKLTEKSAVVTLRLRAATKVTVTVTTSDGKSVEHAGAEATVELRGVDHQSETTKQGKAVFASVVPGGYQIAAWAPGLAHSTTWIQVGAGETTAKVVLVAGAAVRGKVVDDANKPVANARITYHGASDWSQQADARYDAVTSKSDGTFQIAAMPAGTFRFVAMHEAFAPGTSKPVTLDGKTETNDLTITVPTGATVRGRVIDSAKNPVVGARVRIGTGSRRTMSFEPPRQVYSDAKGEFEIKGLSRKPLAIVAMHETGASDLKDVDTTAGDVTGVELAIDVTGTIAGVVVDAAGNPIEGAQVSAGPNFRTGKMDMTQFRLRGFPEELTDAYGKFTLTGLAPGSYEVSAMRERAATRGRRGATEGIAAETGTKDLKIVLQAEGGVKGRVLLPDGVEPIAFTISLGFTEQSFVGTSEFELDALAPQHYSLNVRGPQFTTRAVPIEVEAGKTTDAGTINVLKGRTLAGIVTADGTPVPNATVYAGRQIFGNGTSNTAAFGGMGAPAKTTTTDTDGTFSLSGFNDGDLAITAEQPDIGRSKAMRVPTDQENQGQLVLELQKFGAISGVMTSQGKPVEGIFVSCQSTTAPGAIYGVATGPDGSYRYDKLAPDTYKVSATVGMPMQGMKFYSKEVYVPMSQTVAVDLEVQAGAITLDVNAAPSNGTLGVASAWVASGVIVAKTANDLSLKMAAAGAGASQWVIIRRGEPAKFTELQPGQYSACVVAFPAEVQGMAAMSYIERNSDKLPAVCQQVTVANQPAEQTVNVPVALPAYIPDGGGSGTGSGH